MLSRRRQVLVGSLVLATAFIPGAALAADVDAKPVIDAMDKVRTSSAPVRSEFFTLSSKEGKVVMQADLNPLAHALNGLVGIGAPAKAVAQAAALVVAGFGCLKLKGGAEPAGELVERVEATLQRPFRRVRRAPHPEGTRRLTRRRGRLAGARRRRAQVSCGVSVGSGPSACRLRR